MTPCLASVQEVADDATAYIHIYIYICRAQVALQESWAGMHSPVSVAHKLFILVSSVITVQLGCLGVAIAASRPQAMLQA